jgi:hypothetical protein
LEQFAIKLVGSETKFILDEVKERICRKLLEELLFDRVKLLSLHGHVLFYKLQNRVIISETSWIIFLTERFWYNDLSTLLDFKSEQLFGDLNLFKNAEEQTYSFDQAEVD